METGEVRVVPGRQPGSDLDPRGAGGVGSDVDQQVRERHDILRGGRSAAAPRQNGPQCASDDQTPGSAAFRSGSGLEEPSIVTRRYLSRSVRLDAGSGGGGPGGWGGSGGTGSGGSGSGDGRRADRPPGHRGRMPTDGVTSDRGDVKCPCSWPRLIVRSIPCGDCALPTRSRGFLRARTANRQIRMHPWTRPSHVASAVLPEKAFDIDGRVGRQDGHGPQ